MRRVYRALVRISFNVVLAALMSFSCTQSEADIPTPQLTFADKVEADYDSITLSCTVNGNVTAEKLTIEYSKNKELTGAITHSFEKKGDSFTITITGLEIQTTYYYRYTVENKASSFTDEKIREFKTLDYAVPVVTTVGVKEVSGTKATLEGNVNFSCGKKITAQGFKIGKDQNKLEDKPTELTSLTLKVEGLEFETIYYYQAYATTEIGTGYGEVKEFKTSNAVSFNAIETKDITASSAVVFGGVQDNGGIEIEQQGFRYGEHGLEEFIFVASTGESQLENLKAATTYKVWYYAKTFEGEFESEKAEFTTSDGSITFGETTTTDITSESISLSSSISDDGGSPISKRGFVYSTKTLPTLDGSHISLAGTLGQMVGNITSLTNNTAYYIRPYAVNGVGVSYGSQITVNTLSGLAELGQTNISDIKAESVKFTSNIISANGAAVTEAGFCYSFSKNPTTVDSKVKSQTTTGQIFAEANMLNNNATYYVRAYAITKHGTSYGPEISFTTTTGLAILGQTAIYGIKAQSASFSSEVTSDNGATITERGFCYAEYQSPTTSGNKLSVEGTTGAMTVAVSSLKNDTKYYVRAFATTKFGTTYGAENTFTTNDGKIVFSNLAVSDILPESAKVSVNISDDGGSVVTERGFCYATTEEPTISNKKVTVSLSDNSYIGALTGLAASTKYFVRAYAKNAIGTYYSEQECFTTTSGIATLGLLVATDIKTTSVSLTCEVTSNGGVSIINRGFCYSKSTNPTIFSSKVNVDGTMGSLQGDIMGLDPGSIYYIRAFATTDYGTAYSNEVQLTTMLGLATMASVTVFNIQPTSVMLTSGVAKEGDGIIFEKGYCYGKTTDPTKDDSIAYVNNDWTITVEGLEQNTQYYVRSFATTQYGTSYSDGCSFKTSYYPVTFKNEAYTQALFYRAQVSCDIESFGQNDVLYQGFCYATEPGASINNSIVYINNGESEMKTTISDLLSGTTYYVKGFVTNAIGTFYSAEFSLTTMRLPMGAIPGLFSVSESEKVLFAHGNLYQMEEQVYVYDDNGQCLDIYNKLGIYDNQYDMKNGSSEYPKESYYWGNIYSGENNYPVEGLSNDDTWYSLNVNEWGYLLNERNNYKKLKRYVYINDTPGLLLLPDDFELPSGISGWPSNNTKFDLNDWALLEHSGAVFLPHLVYHTYNPNPPGNITGARYFLYPAKSGSPDWSTSFSTSSGAVGNCRLVYYYR